MVGMPIFICTYFRGACLLCTYFRGAPPLCRWPSGLSFLDSPHQIWSTSVNVFSRPYQRLLSSAPPLCRWPSGLGINFRWKPSIFYFWWGGAWAWSFQGSPDTGSFVFVFRTPSSLSLPIFVGNRAGQGYVTSFWTLDGHVQNVSISTAVIIKIFCYGWKYPIHSSRKC